MLVPLSMFGLLVATPTSEAGLFGRRNKGCDNGSNCYSGPSQCIVGWKTEKRMVTTHEWVTEQKKVNVVEHRTVEEKRNVTYDKREMVKEVRPQKFWVCRPITTEEVREYVVHHEVRENKKGTRTVCRPVTTVETVKRTYDRGHWVTHETQVACYSSPRRGLFGRCCNKGGDCEEQCVTYKTVCHKHWVPKLETVEEKVNVTRHQMVEETFEYVAISHRPEKKSEKVNVTRNQMVEETRDVTYWVCKTTPVTEEVTVRVSRPFTVERVIDVRVCRPVTHEVDVKVPIYGVVECAPAPIYYDSGCGSSRRGGCCK